MESAFEFAKWFIREGYDSPRNTKNGNMKLQKMLYFSQLIHLAKYGSPLFQNKMYAFEKGTVVESVRQEYQYNHDNFVMDSFFTNIELSEEQISTLNVTIDIFGKCSADELSELNHEQFSWRKSYDKSNFGNFHDKELSIIDINDILEYDIDKIKDMLDAYESSKDSDDECIEVNGYKFYFNPQEIHLNDEIMIELENFEGEEDSYYVYFDESAGVVIY